MAKLSCPHCGKFLGKNTFETCPNCSKPLNVTVPKSAAENKQPQQAEHAAENSVEQRPQASNVAPIKTNRNFTPKPASRYTQVKSPTVQKEQPPTQEDVVDVQAAEEYDEQEDDFTFEVEEGTYDEPRYNEELENHTQARSEQDSPDYNDFSDDFTLGDDDDGYEYGDDEDDNDDDDEDNEMGMLLRQNKKKKPAVAPPIKKNAVIAKPPKKEVLRDDPVGDEYDDMNDDDDDDDDDDEPVKTSFNPNHDHYYDDLLPQYEAEIEKIPKEVIVRGIAFALVVIAFVVAAAYRLI